MKISTHFRIEELVPKELFVKFGERSLWFIDQRIIDIAEVVRQRFDRPVMINNWHSGGSLNNRGYRMPDCAIGGTLSQHKRGCAADVNVEGIEVVDVYNDLLKNFDLYKKVGLTTVEDIAIATGWCHLDCRQTRSDQLLIVKP